MDSHPPLVVSSRNDIQVNGAISSENLRHLNLFVKEPPSLVFYLIYTGKILPRYYEEFTILRETYPNTRVIVLVLGSTQEIALKWTEENRFCLTKNFPLHSIECSALTPEVLQSDIVQLYLHNEVKHSLSMRTLVRSHIAVKIFHPSSGLYLSLDAKYIKLSSSPSLFYLLVDNSDGSILWYNEKILIQSRHSYEVLYSAMNGYVSTTPRLSSSNTMFWYFESVNNKDTKLLRENEEMFIYNMKNEYIMVYNNWLSCGGVKEGWTIQIV